MLQLGKQGIELFFNNYKIMDELHLIAGIMGLIEISFLIKFIKHLL